MSSQVDIAQIVAIIGAAYPSFNATKETVSVYYELLKDLPTELAKAAALQCCAEPGRKFAPGVGEIRGAAMDIRRTAEGVPSALEAWGELLHAPKSEETYQETEERDELGRVIIYVTKYKWSHPLVRKVAVMMGFPKFPDWESESYERTAFLKAYDAELQIYLKQMDQLPQVRAYIQDRQAGQLEAGKQIKQLSKGMEK